MEKEIKICGDSVEEIVGKNISLLGNIKDFLLVNKCVDVEILFKGVPVFFYSLSLNDNRDLMIDDIFLSPEYERRGNGKMFFDFLERFSKRQNVRDICYSPSLATSERLIRLLENRGYSFVNQMYRKNLN